MDGIVPQAANAWIRWITSVVVAITLYTSLPSPFATAISFVVVMVGVWLLLKALVRVWVWVKRKGDDS